MLACATCEQAESRSGTAEKDGNDDERLSAQNVANKPSCRQLSASMEIQLAPSETKPFTR